MMWTRRSRLRLWHLQRQQTEARRYWGKKYGTIILILFVLPTSSGYTTTTSLDGQERQKADLRSDIIHIPEPEKLSQFIEYATSYMVRVSHTEEQDSVHFTGRFTYEANLLEELQLDGFDTGRPQHKYNLLRHNGALYALSQSYLRLVEIEQQQQQQRHRQPHDDNSFVISSHEVKATLVRGIEYLKRDAIFPVPDRTVGESYYRPANDIPGLLAAWEREDVKDPNSQLSQAKLGGAGLALIALTQMNLIVPNTTTIEYMRQIGNFIHYMQKDSTKTDATVSGARRNAYTDMNHRRFDKNNEEESGEEENLTGNEPEDEDDGSFVCKYKYKHGPDNSWSSLYYPGEASLGLVLLAEAEFDQSYKQKWIGIATRALKYLERLRRHQKLEEIEPDHWALLATSRILPLLDANSDDYSLLYNHGVRVAESMVNAHTREELMKHHGCFTFDRRTCPTATRLEGLMASLTFIAESELFNSHKEKVAKPLRERIFEDVSKGIEFILSSQQTSTDNNMLGAVPIRFPPKADSAVKDSSVRIDYPQHSMSAVIAYETHLLSSPNQRKKLQLSSDYSKNLRNVILHEGRSRSTAIRNYDFPVASGRLWVNFIIVGLFVVLGIRLVVNVFISPQKGVRQRNLKNR